MDVAGGLATKPCYAVKPFGTRISKILLQKGSYVMLSGAKHLLFLIENKQKADPSLRSG